MSFEFDLSSIVCPTCLGNNDKLEVIGLHVFANDKNDMHPYYEIKCFNCHRVFTKRTPLCIKEA